MKRKHDKAWAVLKAIESSKPGDSVDIHEKSCPGATICSCKLTTITIAGGSERPVGFRMRREE